MKTYPLRFTVEIKRKTTNQDLSIWQEWQAEHALQPLQQPSQDLPFFALFTTLTSARMIHPNTMAPITQFIIVPSCQ
jgi:hypothetical protein